jgi:hypothetical protein
MKSLIFFSLIYFVFSSLSSAETLDSNRWNKVSEKRIHRLFSSPTFLRKIINEDGSLYFQVCEKQQQACKTITRRIRPEELKMESKNLEKEVRYHFRKEMAAGTLLFSETLACTPVGIVIAAVPGLAGGAVICFSSESERLQVTELPLNILALNRLATEMGSRTEKIAQGEDGEVYVANLDLIVRNLKTRFPKEEDGPSEARPNP